LLDFKEIEKACQKAKIIGKKPKAYQRQTSRRSLKEYIPKSIPPHKSTPPPYTRQDKDRGFKCNIPNCKPEHKCKDKKQFHCKIDKSDNDKDEEAWGISSFDEETSNGNLINSHKSGNQNASPTLSITAMTGISQPQTLKVYVYVKKTKVIVFNDSGSSHNFIYTKIKKKLNIFIYPTSKFQVSIPRNRTASCDGKCHKVEVSMNDYNLKYPMYVIVAPLLSPK
jgi:hypothetical protein